MSQIHSYKNLIKHLKTTQLITFLHNIYNIYIRKNLIDFTWRRKPPILLNLLKLSKIFLQIFLNIISFFVLSLPLLLIYIWFTCFCWKFNAKFENVEKFFISYSASQLLVYIYLMQTIFLVFYSDEKSYFMNNA